MFLRQYIYLSRVAILVSRLHVPSRVLIFIPLLQASTEVLWSLPKLYVCSVPKPVS
jgi:hypothetical protein